MPSNRLVRAGILAGIFTLALVLPTTADTTPGPGGTGAKIVITNVFLMNAVTIDIHADVTCALSSPFFESAFGQITQSSAGKRVAHGTTFTSSPGVTCDGAPHQLLLRIVADPGGAAFKSGAASAEVSFQACFFSCVSGDTGWVGVRVRQWPNSQPWPPLAVSPPMSPPVSGAVSRP